MASKEINILIKAKNLASGAIKSVNKELGTIGKHAQRGMGNAARNIERGVMVAGAAAAGGLAYAVKTAIDFEDAFAGVRKTVEATEGQFESLHNSLRDLSKETGMAFEELSGIAEQGGALGIQTDAIDEFTRVVALLGVTTNLTTEGAAASLGKLSNVLKMSSEDYDNFGATLVDLGNKGASTEDEILQLAERAGAGAALIGVATDQTLGWSAAVANLGIEAEAGGSALQKFFIESLKNVQDDNTLGVMAETAGMTGQAFKKAFEEDASGALETFIVGLGALKDTERLTVLEDLGFNDIRITRTLLGLAGNTENLGSALDIASSAWKENTALTTEAQKRFDTLAQRMGVLKAHLRDAAYVIGSEVMPVVNDLVKEFTDWLAQPGSQEKVRDLAKDIANHIRGIVDWGKGLNWEAIGSALQTAAAAGKMLLEAFLSMPGWLQGAIATGWGLNKLTGGALGGIIGELGKGIIKGILNMNAGVVNINAGVVNGGPGGLPGAAAKGGGFLSSLMGGLKVGAAVAAPALAGVAAIEVVNFENMRAEQRDKLGGILDEMPRTPERIDRSIAAIQEQINMERPLLEGVLFNTNIRPQLEQEIAELREVKAAQARTEAAARDAIPWHQRNVTEIQNLNASEATRHSATWTTANAQLVKQQEAIAAVNATQGPLNTIAAKNFSPVVNVSTHVNAFLSVNEWQRTARSANTSYSTNTGGI